MDLSQLSKNLTVLNLRQFAGVESTKLQEIIAPQVTFGLDAARSTNGLLFQQSFRSLGNYEWECFPEPHGAQALCFERYFSCSTALGELER